MQTSSSEKLWLIIRCQTWKHSLKLWNPPICRINYVFKLGFMRNGSLNCAIFNNSWNITKTNVLVFWGVCKNIYFEIIWLEIIVILLKVNIFTCLRQSVCRRTIPWLRYVWPLRIIQKTIILILLKTPTRDLSFALYATFRRFCDWIKW